MFHLSSFDTCSSSWTRIRRCRRTSWDGHHHIDSFTICSSGWTRINESWSSLIRFVFFYGKFIGKIHFLDRIAWFVSFLLCLLFSISIETYNRHCFLFSFRLLNYTSAYHWTKKKQRFCTHDVFDFRLLS